MNVARSSKPGKCSARNARFASGKPSRGTTPNAASPSLPFPPPGTAGKTVGPTRNVKPDEPGTIDQDVPGDAGVNAAAGSGNRDFGHP